MSVNLEGISIQSWVPGEFPWVGCTWKSHKCWILRQPECSQIPVLKIPKLPNSHVSPSMGIPVTISVSISFWKRWCFRGAEHPQTSVTIENQAGVCQKCPLSASCYIPTAFESSMGKLFVFILLLKISNHPFPIPQVQSNFRGFSSNSGAGANTRLFQPATGVSLLKYVTHSSQKVT